MAFNRGKGAVRGRWSIDCTLTGGLVSPRGTLISDARVRVLSLLVIVVAIVVVDVIPILGVVVLVGLCGVEEMK